MNAAEAKSFLESLSLFGMRFGLSRMQAALAALGHPERRFEVLHVAGTNGKGSTCAFAASILRAAGHRVGLYTSPHLLRMNERIDVDARPITDEETALGTTEILRAFPAAKDPADPLTFFEFDTLLALWHFARVGARYAVLETGLGGRLDATNAVASKVAAVTRIGLDHTALLGNTLAAIALEKAAIFKEGARAVVARQGDEALAVLLAAAKQPLVAGRDYALEGEGPFAFRAGDFTAGDLTLSLAGPFQRENAEAAIAAARLMDGALTERSIRDGLQRTVWPGRLEVVDRNPLTILDGAHNPDAARALGEAMRALYPGARVHLVFGMLADKDVPGVASLLVPLAKEVYLAGPKSERALSPLALRQLVLPMGVHCRPFDSIAEALSAARAAAAGEGEGSLVLVAGSLYVVGEAKSFFENARKPSD